MLFLIFLAIAAVTGQVTYDATPPTTTGPPWVTCPQNLCVGGIYYKLTGEGECKPPKWPIGIWPACLPCLELDELPNSQAVCIYEMWGIPGSKYCLKPGDQKTCEKSPPPYPANCTIYYNRKYKSPVIYQQYPLPFVTDCITKCNEQDPYCRGWSYGPGPGPCNLYSIGLHNDGQPYGLFLGEQTIETIGWISSTRGCPLLIG